ncbi:MAG: glycosyltransferase family 39 protein [Bryobacterales bacterium]|nr:glycosyltransferase family 39 protein [Acidobacteriota bacterium]MBV9401823.1 glycosyltransferase family 39 protein [Bryobacterales bacterium]
MANSVLEPSWRQMFFYPRWAQTTPPLVLSLMRGAVHLFGSGEIALRLVPLIAGTAAVLVFGVAAKKMFSAPIACLATTFLATNYWAIKYSQQAKQYATDLLLATSFIYIIQELHHRRNRRTIWLLVLASGVGSFLSLTSAFWCATSILAIAWNDMRTRAWSSSIIKECLRVRSLVTATIFGTCLAVSYLLFFRPNVTPGFSRFWSAYTLGSGRRAFLTALHTFVMLLVPPVHRLAYPAGLLLLTLVGVGAFKVMSGTRKNDSLSTLLLLVAVMPIMSAVLLSLAKLVPLGNSKG